MAEARADVPVAPEADHDLEALLEYLRDVRAFDFTGYERADLVRRIDRHIEKVGADGYGAYTSVLEANPGEFAELFDTILVDVTGFLRDNEAWEFVASEILPAMVAERGPLEPIRVWSAGTASGEEAYSLAVLLTELLGEEQFRTMVKIYATDADEAALVEARHARYPTDRVLKAFGQERTHRFFEIEGATSVFRQDLRRSLVFGRHDLVQHPPISRIDLLVCRNTLMYFTADVQRQVLTNFSLALAGGGYLFMGRSEAMAAHTNQFEVVDPNNRVYRRATGEAGGSSHPDPGRAEAMIRAAFEEAPVAQVVVDPAGVVIAVNRRARTTFGIGQDAVGQPLGDLPVSRRPPEIQSLVDEVLAARRPLSVRDVVWMSPSGGQEHFEVALLPLASDGELGVVVNYTPIGG